MGETEVFAHGVRVHPEPFDQLDGVVGGASDQPQQLAQRLPLGVPGTGRPLVLGDHRRVERGGQPRRAPRGGGDHGGRHRVGLVRHGGRPATAPLRDLGDLRAGEGEYVGRHLAEGPGREGQSTGQVGDGCPQGVPGQHRFREPEFTGVRRHERARILGAERREGGQRPARTAQLGGDAEIVEPVPRVQHERPPPRRLQPEGRRHGVLREGPARHHRVPVRGGEPAQRSRRPLQVRQDQVQRAAGDQHQRRVQDVLAGRAPVDIWPVLLADRRRQIRDQRNHRIAAPSGAQRDRPDVEVRRGDGGHRRRRRGRGEPESRLSTGQRRLGIEERPQKRAVRGRRRRGGAHPPGGEQPGVRVGLGTDRAGSCHWNSRKTVSPSP